MRTVRRPCLLRMVGVLVRSMYVCMYVCVLCAGVVWDQGNMCVWCREEEEEEEEEEEGEAGGVSCKMQDGCRVG